MSLSSLLVTRFVTESTFVNIPEQNRYFLFSSSLPNSLTIQAHDIVALNLNKNVLAEEHDKEKTAYYCYSIKII